MTVARLPQPLEGAHVGAESFTAPDSTYIPRHANESNVSPVDQSQLAIEVGSANLPATIEAPVETVTPEVTAEQQDRFSTRILLKIAGLAESASNKSLDAATSLSERRTTSELINDKLESGRAVSRKIGGHIGKVATKSNNFVKTNVIDTVKEVGVGFKETGQQAKAEYIKADKSVETFVKGKIEGHKEKRTASREAAQARKQLRKDTRIQAKTERREKRQENIEALKARGTKFAKIGRSALTSTVLLTAGASIYAVESGAKGTSKLKAASLNGGRNAANYVGSKVENAVALGGDAVDAYAESLQEKAKAKAKTEDLKTSRKYEKAYHRRQAAYETADAKADAVKAKADAKANAFKAKHNAKHAKKVA